ncbi:ABC1 kinase family protein [Petrachloros mirabilis]
MSYKIRRAFQIITTVAYIGLFVIPFKRADAPRLIRIALQELGGAWAKIGQALALRFDLLDPMLCYELFELLNQMKPFDYSEVRAVIRTELHGDPEQLFACFEREPFAAASIGQVHRATLLTGERVAVKVQRPDVRQAMAVDITFLFFAAAILDIFGALGSMSARSFVHQFERSVYEELNFRNEARHARMMADKAQGNTVERHAKVFVRYTTERVLTTALLEGVSFLELLSRCDSSSSRLDEETLDNICLHLFENTLRQVFDNAYFHADLHPANIFVLPNDVIGYVDFGIVGTLSPRLRDSLTSYAMYLFRGDIERSTQELMRWITPSSRTDIESARGEIVGIAEEYYCSVTYEKGQEGQNSFASYQINVLNAVRRHHMAISPSIVASFRSLISVISMIYQLNPAFPLRKHANRFFSSLILDEVARVLSPRELVRGIFNLQLQVQHGMNALDSMEQNLRSGQPTTVTAQTRDLKRYAVLGSLSVVSLIVVVVFDLSLSGLSAGALLGVLGGGAVLFAFLTLREAGRIRGKEAARRRAWLANWK